MTGKNKALIGIIFSRIRFTIQQELATNKNVTEEEWLQGKLENLIFAWDTITGKFTVIISNGRHDSKHLNTIAKFISAFILEDVYAPIDMLPSFQLTVVNDMITNTEKFTLFFVAGNELIHYRDITVPKYKY